MSEDSLIAYASQGREFAGVNSRLVRAMAYIADADHRRMRAKDMAASMGISVSYAHRLMGWLGKRGFVRLFQGPLGGPIETGCNPHGQIYTLTDRAQRLFGALALAVAASSTAAPVRAAETPVAQPTMIKTGQPTLLAGQTQKPAEIDPHSITRARRRADFQSYTKDPLPTRACNGEPEGRAANPGGHPPATIPNAAPTPGQDSVLGVCDGVSTPVGLGERLSGAWDRLKSMVAGGTGTRDPLLLRERRKLRPLADAMRARLATLAAAKPEGCTTTRNGSVLRWTRRSRTEWCMLFKTWICDHSISPETIEQWLGKGLTAERVEDIVDPYNWCQKYVPILEWIESENARADRILSSKLTLQNSLRDERAHLKHDKEIRREVAQENDKRQAWISEFFAEFLK
jgi:hypothetical protein